MGLIEITSWQVQQGRDGQYSLVVEAEFDGAERVVFIPVHAAPERREFYGLADDEAAVRAILREHYCRINGLDTWPRAEGSGRMIGWHDLTDEQKREALGGLHPDIEVRVRGEGRLIEAE